MLGGTIGRLTARIARAINVAAANGASVHEIRGFRVVVENSRPDIATPDVLERLEQALDLIAQYQPWRLAHLRRDLQEFWVIRYACRGAYFPADRACLTELTFLNRRDITAAPVASSIVHEGIHARVHAMGVSPESRDMAREERLCRRAELEFGRALPPDLGAPVIARATESLLLSDNDVAPTVDWREAARRVRSVDANSPRP